MDAVQINQIDLGFLEERKAENDTNRTTGKARAAN